MKAQLKLGYASQKRSPWDNRGDSIITSRPGSSWVHTLFVVLCDDKLGEWVVLDYSPWRHRKKISMKNFCIINEKITYKECVIQSSMFYCFYLFFSIFFCNLGSALVSNSNVCTRIEWWISNLRIMFKCSNLYSNVEGMYF